MGSGGWGLGASQGEREVMKAEDCLCELGDYVFGHTRCLEMVAEREERRCWVRLRWAAGSGVRAHGARSAKGVNTGLGL